MVKLGIGQVDTKWDLFCIKRRLMYLSIDPLKHRVPSWKMSPGCTT